MAINTLGTRRERGIDFARELFNAVNEATDHVGELQRLASELAFDWDEDEADETAELYPSISLTWDLVSSMLEKLCQRNLGEGDFYAELYALGWESRLFGDDEERVRAILCMLANPRIPYVLFDPPSMSQERFDECKKDIADELRILSQVAYRSFPQKTQEALAVLGVLDRCASEDHKTVALAMFLSLVRELA